MDANNLTPGLHLIAAGFVDSGGQLVRSAGRALHVEKEATGIYHVIFDKVLATIPIVVATSDGGPKGSFAEILPDTMTVNGFKVTGRDYGEHKLADIGFNFIVAMSVA